MIPAKLIKLITLGPRQMTFGFDDRESEMMETLFSHIEKEYQSTGPIRMDEFVSAPPEENKFSGLEILQTIFWLAEELKIHFIVEKQITEPSRVKQQLLNRPESRIHIVINRQVADPQFEAAKKTGVRFIPEIPEDLDQYAFSRLVVHELLKWQSRLSSYRPLASQPHFPGQKEIKNGLVLLDRMLEKKDSYSIIHVCLKYKNKIIALSETQAVLTQFYTRKKAFWQEFIDDMSAFKKNRAEIEKDPRVSMKYKRLSEILSLPSPYQLVAEAEKLLPDVRRFHRKLEEEKMIQHRLDAVEKTDKMITKLISLFDTFDSNPEYRNTRLNSIRLLKKKIESNVNIDKIDAFYNDAKDLFIDTIEEL